MLECETRYLPLPSEFSSSPASHLVAEIPLSLPEKTNGLDEPVPSKSSGSGVSAMRPTTQNRRIAAVFGSVVESAGSIVKPLPSSSQPHTHVARKRSPSPLTKTVRSSDSVSVSSDVGSVAADQQFVKAAVAQRSRKTTPTFDAREKNVAAAKALTGGLSLGDRDVGFEREVIPNHPSKSMKDAKNWNRFQSNLATTEPEGWLTQFVTCFLLCR